MTHRRFEIATVIVVAVLLALTAVQCSSEKPTTTSPRPDFPNTTGSWWLYAVSRSPIPYPDHDSVRVNVMNSVRTGMDSVLALRWQYAYLPAGSLATVGMFDVSPPSRAGSQAARETTHVYSFLPYSLPYEMWVTPLTPGDSWTCPRCWNTQLEWSVSVPVTIDVPAGQFRYAYPIRSFYSFPCGYRIDTTWFVHGVGKVAFKRFFRSHDGGGQNWTEITEEEELVRYYIASP